MLVKVKYKSRSTKLLTILASDRLPYGGKCGCTDNCLAYRLGAKACTMKQEVIQGSHNI